MNSANEVPVTIQGNLPTPMLGMLHRPADGAPSSGTGVVIVNGGAQYRAGAHRLFVQLARHLTVQGHAVLRFDFPGQGDSPGEPVHFENTAMHIGTALDALEQQQPMLQRFALVGLCDGASACLLYQRATQDRRVCGLVLLNPWLEDAQSAARAKVKHYYRQRLQAPDFWRKLLRGGVGLAAAKDLLRSLRRMRQTLVQAVANAPADEPHAQRMGAAWLGLQLSVLLLLSDRDLTAQRFYEHAQSHADWQRSFHPPQRTLQWLPGADHTLTPVLLQQQMFNTTTAWLDHLAGTWTKRQQT